MVSGRFRWFLVLVTTCKSDSTSATVFKQAVHEWGLPSNVRGDMGFENRDVVFFLYSPKVHKDQEEGVSSQEAASTHVWRDVYEMFCQVFMTHSYHWWKITS